MVDVAAQGARGAHRAGDEVGDKKAAGVAAEIENDATGSPRVAHRRLEPVAQIPPKRRPAKDENVVAPRCLELETVERRLGRDEIDGRRSVVVIHGLHPMT